MFNFRGRSRLPFFVRWYFKGICEILADAFQKALPDLETDSPQSVLNLVVKSKLLVSLLTGGAKAKSRF